MLLLFVTSTAIAQEKQKKIQTAEFEVSGVCNMCKKRIEAAALIKGVRFAEWNKLTQIVKVIYSTKATDVQTIQTAIAAAGHDTEGVKASDEVYTKLNKCCQYRGDLEVH